MLGIHDGFKYPAIPNDDGEEGEREGRPCRGAFGEAWESRATREAKARRTGEAHGSATRVEEVRCRKIGYDGVTRKCK